MGKKYDVYDEEGNKVAHIERITYEKEDMPFLSILLFEFAVAFMGVLLTPYSVCVVPYLCVLITFGYLLIFLKDNCGQV